MGKRQGAERLEQVVVVLVATSHPGNVGACARAMKTMGLGRLRLVAPRRIPSAEATERAAGADDVLHEAEVFASLDEALSDIDWAVATSARARRLDWPALTPEACARSLLERAAEGRVALVFGRESSGLSNAELDRCQAVVRIPAVDGFSSLNLGAAVQVLAYALRQAWIDGASASHAPVRPLATPDQLEGLYRHLEVALAEIGYYDPVRPKLLMRRLRRLCARAQLETAELNVLRGILHAAQAAARGRDPNR